MVNDMSPIQVENPEPPKLNTDVNPEGVNEFAESQYAETARKVIRLRNNLRDMGYVDLLLIVVT